MGLQPVILRFDRSYDARHYRWRRTALDLQTILPREIGKFIKVPPSIRATILSVLGTDLLM